MVRLSNSVMTLAVAFLFAASLSAQSCSDLAVSGTLASGGNVQFDVTGAPADSPTAIFFAQNAGMTSLPFGIVLDLDFPAIPAVFGRTDAMGDLTFNFNIPTVPASVAGMYTLHCQALTIDLSSIMPPSGGMGGGGFMPFTVCVSDAEMFTLNL